MAKRVVLAYSGGLDTSVAVKWMGEEWGTEVVALAVDVGQGVDDDWDTIRAVAHGCTGKGNDQVRFEVSARALAPDLELLAPVRVWGLTREDSIEYAAKHGIPVRVRKDSPYSVDENLWGRTIECGILEDPWVEPPEEVFALTSKATKAPREPRELVIGFEGGVPMSLDGAP